MICHLICILVYDQICIDALNSKDDGSSTCGSQEVTIDWFNTLLNYALIIANAAAIVLSMPGQHSAAIPERFAAHICLALAIAFQLTLCLFIVDCVGVSIIWCSMFGWLLMCMRISPSSSRIQSITTITTPTKSTVARTVVFLDCGAIVFYAVILEIISTIAHCLAVVMGVVLWKAASWSNTFSNKTEMREKSNRTADR